MTDANWPRLKKKLDAALTTRDKDREAARQQTRIRNRVYILSGKYNTWRHENRNKTDSPLPSINDLVRFSEDWRAFVEHGAVEDETDELQELESDDEDLYHNNAATKSDTKLWSILLDSIEVTIRDWQMTGAAELADLIRSPLDKGVENATLLAAATSAFVCKKCSAGADAQPHLLTYPTIVHHHCFVDTDLAGAIVDDTERRSLGSQVAAVGPKARVAIEQMLEAVGLAADTTWADVDKLGHRFFVSPSFDIPDGAADEYKALLSSRHAFSELVRLVVNSGKLDVAPYVRLSLPSSATREEGDASIVEWASCSQCSTRIATEREIWAHVGKSHGVVPKVRRVERDPAELMSQPTHIKRFLAEAEPADDDGNEDAAMEVDDE